MYNWPSFDLFFFFLMILQQISKFKAKKYSKLPFGADFKLRISISSEMLLLITNILTNCRGGARKSFYSFLDWLPRQVLINKCAKI